MGVIGLLDRVKRWWGGGGSCRWVREGYMSRNLVLYWGLVCGSYGCLLVVLEVYGGGRSIYHICTVVNCSEDDVFVGF